jgi:hypothetical protein
VSGLDAPKPVQAPLQDKQLARRCERVDADLLHREADPAADLSGLRDDVVARHARAPGGGPHECAEHADGGRLARSVRSQQPVALARRDAERHGAHRLGAVRIDLAETLDDDRIASEVRKVVAVRTQLHELVEHALESVLHRCS